MQAPKRARNAPRVSLRPFLLASLLIHLGLAFFLPAPGLLRLAGNRGTEGAQAALPGGEGSPAKGPGTSELGPFLPLGALRLQVLEIEIESEALAFEGSHPVPAPKEPAPVPSPLPPSDEPPREDLAAEIGTPAGVGPAGETGSGSESGLGSEARSGSGSGSGSGAPGATGGGEGGQVVPPVIIAMSWPQYPKEARERPSVPIVLAVHVTETGLVDAVRVENASGCPACERAAVESAWRLRCLPASRGGKPLAMWMRFPVTFGRR